MRLRRVKAPAYLSDSRNLAYIVATRVLIVILAVMPDAALAYVQPHQADEVNARSLAELRGGLDAQLARYASQIELAVASGRESEQRRADLSEEEYMAFRGIGAIVCTVKGVRRGSTAFLVGGFDIAVTVAHTFERDGRWAHPGDCVYTSSDSLGEIRERILVAYYKTQWEAEAGAFGQPAKDLAVVRLARPSRFARRTLSFTRFVGSTASVIMIGFPTDLSADVRKRKLRGSVYRWLGSRRAVPSVAGLMHDMDSRNMAAGAPVLDRRDGVVIGIHIRVPANTTFGGNTERVARRRNAMIVMSEWLRRTLRAEIAAVSRTQSG